jgi:hypothetical protein
MSDEAPNLSVKIFQDTCCKDCCMKSENESAPIVQIDNMGRPVITD